MLDIADLRIDTGERVFIQGRSGSGKTTLLNILGGLMLPQAGAVEVLGKSMTAMPGGARDAFRADQIGFVFQMFNLVPYLSVIENVTLPCLFSGERRARATARAATVEAEAARLLEHMGIGGAELAGSSAAELSVGQQQRVAAARALIGRPGLVIADEPTSALDLDTRRAFLELLFAEVAACGATLVFVSHDTALADAFDRTLSFADINRAGGR